MLTLFVGPCANGKSTFCRNIMEGDNDDYFFHLSSDSLREAISGDENNQECSAEAFRTMEIMTRYLLKRGYYVLADATFLTKKARKPFLKIAKDAGVEIKCVYFNVPIAEAKRRNAARQRVVPEHVIDKQYAKLEVPDFTEFGEIEVITPDEYY